MSRQSGFHYYLNWAKARIDEMDATLIALEGKAAELTAGAREKADQILADLRKTRDDFGTASISRRKPTRPLGRA